MSAGRPPGPLHAGLNELARMMTRNAKTPAPNVTRSLLMKSIESATIIGVVLGFVAGFYKLWKASEVLEEQAERRRRR